MVFVYGRGNSGKPDQTAIALVKVHVGGWECQAIYDQILLQQMYYEEQGI